MRWSAVRSTAWPCLGGMASKGGLHPSRRCKRACDAASDAATIRRLRLGMKPPAFEETGNGVKALPHAE